MKFQAGWSDPAFKCSGVQGFRVILVVSGSFTEKTQQKILSNEICVFWRVQGASELLQSIDWCSKSIRCVQSPLLVFFSRMSEFDRFWFRVCPPPQKKEETEKEVDIEIASVVSGKSFSTIIIGGGIISDYPARHRLLFELVLNYAAASNQKMYRTRNMTGSPKKNGKSFSRRWKRIDGPNIWHHT